MSRSGEHELSSTVKECQESLSIVKFSYKIDWGLLVEGKTDEVFYKKITDKLATFHGSPESYENADIPKIVAEKRRNNQNFFGIIDADYKKHVFSGELQNYIQITDANSLETMMVKYYGFAAFEQIIRKLIKKMYTGNKFNLKEKIMGSIVDMSVQWAYTIGILRKYNENRKCLSINTVKEISNYYFDFLKSSKTADTQIRISFDQEKYLRELLRLLRLNKCNITIDDLKNEIQKNTFSEEDAYILCQGHDIIDFIEAIIKVYGLAIAKNKNESDKIMKKKRGAKDKVTRMEYDILDMYDISRFEKAPLYQWLETIDKEYKEKIN